MPEPIDSAVILEDLSAGIAQTQYDSKFTDQVPDQLQDDTNRLFKPYPEEIVGTGKTFQMKLARADSARSSNDPLGPFAAPDVFEPDTITVRFNKSNLAANDFTTISCSCQTDDIDIREKGKGSIVDFVEEMVDEIDGNYDEKLAILRHLPKTAVMATVNGTPVTNAAQNYVSTAAAASNTVGLRVPVTTGSIGAFARGKRVAFLTTAGVARVSNVRVTDVNYADLSIGVEFVTGSSIPARNSLNGTGSLASVVSGDLIVASNSNGSNEFNTGIYSMGAYFGRPTSGESFIGGVDRTTASKRYMLPVATREGLSNTRIQRSHFNDLAIAMGFRENKKIAGVFMLDPTLHQTLRDDIGEDAFIPIPPDDARTARFANFGNIGLNYQHPTFGLVKFMACKLCPPNTVRFIVPEVWRQLFYAFKGLQTMPGEIGNWKRLPEAAPNSGFGKIYKMDFYALTTDWCMKPWENGEILNVTA